MNKGQDIGYVRVSSIDQNTDRQLDGITLERIFEDKVSGKTTNRPALTECLDYLRSGDTLHVHSMDRLARNLNDLECLVKALTAKGIGVQFYKENLIFTGDDSAMSMLLLQVMGAVAQFERANINERQREGIAKAKAQGKHLGRKPSMTPEDIQKARDMVADGMAKADVASFFGVSRQTLYRVLK